MHADWLGTKRVMTSIGGTVSQTCKTLSFGDGQNCTGTDSNFNRFTDDVHDFETNLEHTWFRQLSTTQGRWMGADPYLGSMDLANPQSMNRYGYVLNAPTALADPMGLAPKWAEVGTPDFRFMEFEFLQILFNELNGTESPDGSYDPGQSRPCTAAEAGGSDACVASTPPQIPTVVEIWNFAPGTANPDATAGAAGIGNGLPDQGELNSCVIQANRNFVNGIYNNGPKPERPRQVLGLTTDGVVGTGTTMLIGRLAFGRFNSFGYFASRAAVAGKELIRGIVGNTINFFNQNSAYDRAIAACHQRYGN